MTNVVFKLLDRSILTENPSSVEGAVHDVRHLFSLPEDCSISFHVYLPQVGLAELSDSSWKQLEYGSLINVTCTPVDRHGSDSALTEELLMANWNALLPKKSDELLSVGSDNSNMRHSKDSSFSSISVSEVMTILSSTASSRSGSQEPISFGAARKHFSLNSPNHNLTLNCFGESRNIHGIEVFLEYPNDINSPSKPPVSTNLNLNQPFHVLLGTLAKRFSCRAERIELWLLRGSKVIKISPIVTPDELQIQAGERIRVRIRSPVPEIFTSVVHSPSDVGSAPVWIASFAPNKRNLHGVGLPTDPRPRN